MTNNWRLYRLEHPPCDGVYEVRLFKIDAHLDSAIDVLMEYENGTWMMRDALFINDYYVNAWRNL